MKNREITRLLENGSIDEAKLALHQNINSDSDDKSSWTKLAAIATRTANFEEGIEPFKNLVRISPRAPLASSGLAMCYFECGRYAEAEAEIDRFSQQFSQDVTSLSVTVESVLSEHKNMLERIRSK